MNLPVLVFRDRAVLAWLCWLVMCALILVFKTPVTTDLTAFLPSRAGTVDAVLLKQMRDGDASRMLLVAIEGGSQAELAELSRRLTASLRTTRYFETVSNGDDPAMLENLERRLFARRYVLSPDFGPTRLESPALRRELEASLAELASPTGFLYKQWLARDPSGEWRRLLREWLAVEGLTRHRGVWFSSDGIRALLLLRCRSSGFDLAAQTELQAHVRVAFADLHPPRNLRLRLAGPGVIGVEANARITRDATYLTWVNASLVTLLLFAVYRSVRVLGLSLLPLVTGMLSGAAVTSAVFQGLHGVTIGFGAAVVGVAADYPNHFFTHVSARESPDSAMERIWPTLRLGLVTNVAAFALMLFSDFSGLAQLAVFAVTGLLGAGLCTRWVLPTLAGSRIHLPAWIFNGPVWLPACLRLGAVRAIPLTVAACLGILFALGSVPLWNDDVATLNPASAELLRESETIGRDFGMPDLRHVVVLTASSEEGARRLSETVASRLDMIQAEGVFRSYEMAARYLPSDRTQRFRLAALPDRRTMTQRLREAQRGLPFRMDLFEPFLAQIEDIRNQLPLNRDDLAGTPLAEKVDSLLFEVNGRWTALLPLNGLQNAEAVVHGLAEMGEPDVQLVDLRVHSTQVMRSYRREAIALLYASVAAIVMILTLGLGSLHEALRVLAPVLLAGFCTALTMAYVSGGLNLYHLVALLLVLGLSLDQSLFFNRDAADPEEWRRTLLSLCLCGLSAVLAFGTLAISEVNVLRAIGGTVALGASFALIFAALLARRTPDPG